MDFVAKRWWFMLLSLAVIGAGIISMAVPPAFRVGIEFTGGSALSANFDGNVQQDALRAALAEVGHPEATIQGLGGNAYLIRTHFLKDAQRDDKGNVTAPSEKETIEARLNRLAPVRSLELDSVAPVVAAETVRNAVIAVIAASFFILLYIWFAFRKVAKPWRMGVTAVIALLHDVLVTLGVFSIMSKVMNVEVNAMFITAALTVVGYSVHDTIVVFDRIRENSLKGATKDLASTVNASILETVGRSLNTSLTTIFVIVALLLLGGATVQTFLLTLLVGIITGTYSSIFIAAQLLVMWDRGEWRPPLGRRGVVEAPTAARPARA